MSSKEALKVAWARYHGVIKETNNPDMLDLSLVGLADKMSEARNGRAPF